MFPKLDPKGKYLAEEGFTLREFELMVGSLHLEHGCIFDAAGDALMKVKIGTEYKIELSERECELLRNSIFSHNHPRGAFLSPADIRMAVLYGALEVRAVTGERVFAARRQARSWPPLDRTLGVFRHVDDVVSKFLKDERLEARTLGKEAELRFLQRRVEVEFDKYAELLPMIGISVSRENVD